MDMTQESIRELRRAEEVEKINALLNVHGVDAIAVPDGISVKSLEPFRAHRQRLTGMMETSEVASFYAYVHAFAAERADDSTPTTPTLVFVDPKHMAARAVLNFGTIDQPGHADHSATLKLEMTAEYSAMLKIAEMRSAQKAAAEWCEDHITCITFLGGDGEIVEPARAIKAIRNLKVEDVQKSNSGVGNFNRERTLMETTKVDTSEGLPHFLLFKCVPYQGLAEREFKVRLGVGKDARDEPAFTFQIVRHDLEVQKMAEELAALVRKELGTLVDVYLGNFTK